SGRPRRRRRRPEGGPCQGVAREALRLGGGVALRRPGRPGLRRPRLHARVPGRALPPRAPRRPDLGGHLRDPAADRRPSAREARRRAGRRMIEPAATTDGTPPVAAPDRTRAAPTPPAISLGPLFAPRSIAVVGASARGGIARTVRN